MLTAPMREKIDNMKEHMGNLSTDENSKKKKKMLVLKNTETEMKNAFDGLNSRLRTAP